MDLDKLSAFIRDTLEYQIGNPSAWDYYDDRVSEMIRKVVNEARKIQGLKEI